jgi:hypothetical protein
MIVRLVDVGLLEVGLLEVGWLEGWKVGRLDCLMV